MSIEKIILENLISNDAFTRHVLPHLKEEYFEGKISKIIFTKINEFFAKHAKRPNKKIMNLLMSDITTFTQDEFNSALNYLEEFDSAPEDRIEWLTERTEAFCKERAVYLALMEAIKITDGQDKNKSKDGIPKILQDALSVSFDKNIGHDYITGADERYDYYHTKENKVPFALDIFNKITGGGASNKSLTIMMSPTGVGKSFFMSNWSSFLIQNGYKVLYVTLELAEKEVAKRIDCNLMDVTPTELMRMSKGEYSLAAKKISQYTGNLVIKEYPTCGAHAGHFRSLLEELKVMKSFVPQIIFIDYLNICASSRMKLGNGVNSYTFVKSIAEELRGLAVQYDVPIFSATQTNRNGSGNTDVELTDVSESSGLPATVDFMFAGMRTEELDGIGQIMFKQLKSRWGDINYYKRFVCGVDLSKFRLYDVEIATQSGFVDKGKNTPQKEVHVFDRGRSTINIDDISFD